MPLLFSHSALSSSLRPHRLQHARLPCPSPTPRACSNSRPLSRWCHPAISSSVVPFSSCPQSLPASESFPVSRLFQAGGQSIGTSASASVLPMNIQDWFPLGWTGWISLESKGKKISFGYANISLNYSGSAVILFKVIEEQKSFVKDTEHWAQRARRLKPVTHQRLPAIRGTFKWVRVSLEKMTPSFWVWVV